MESTKKGKPKLPLSVRAKLAASAFDDGYFTINFCVVRALFTVKMAV